MARKRYVVINATHDGYSPDQLDKSITVQELIDLLENDFDSRDEIILSFDRGYTYGRLTEYRFEERVFDDEEE